MIIECFEYRQYVKAKETGSYWRHFDGREPSCHYTLLAVRSAHRQFLCVKRISGTWPKATSGERLS